MDLAIYQGTMKFNAHAHFCTHSFSLSLPLSFSHTSTHTHNTHTIRTVPCTSTFPWHPFRQLVGWERGRGAADTATCLCAVCRYVPLIVPAVLRVDQNRIYTPYKTVYLVISLPKIPCIQRIYIYIHIHKYLYVYGIQRMYIGTYTQIPICIWFWPTLLVLYAETPLFLFQRGCMRNAMFVLKLYS